jgi:glycosyltransferase involved in cell wall biosynthesis
MSRELVVLSHLRWTFVWQRPQHLISRLAGGYSTTWFVEEPEPVEGVTAARLRTEVHGPVTRVWLEVPPERGVCGFDREACARYCSELAELIGDRVDTVWAYTPMALEVARAMHPTTLVYDVMDDLAAFRFAAPETVLRQRQMLREASVVFTGGRSLHRSVREYRRTDAYCFPSGVDREHFASAPSRRASRRRTTPVAGYVGVIDERIDLDLVAALAEHAPDWEFKMVGPVVKVDPGDLPQAENLLYPGPCDYAELPQVMADFDVALMPFALNDATRSISPTKTLEYLAAGLPVVSTRVPDVVHDGAGIVELRDDGAGFAAACRELRTGTDPGRGERAEALLREREWDTIAAAMARRLQRVAASAADEETA